MDEAQNALNRMRRAHNRKTGCYLTTEMIAELALTSIGQMWEELDPRTTGGVLNSRIVGLLSKFAEVERD